MTFCQALLMGALHGLTEFLPVSPEAHARLARALFPALRQPDPAFSAAAVLGALGAVITAFRRELRPICLGIPRLIRSLLSPGDLAEKLGADPAARYLLLLAIGAAPLGVASGVLRGVVRTAEGPAMLAASFLAMGLLLVGTARAAAGRRRIGVRDAVLLGIAQAFSVLPTLSRAGLALAAGSYMGIERGTLATFALVLAIPQQAAAVELALRTPGPGIGWGPILAGLAASYVAGLVALRLLIPLVLRGRLAWFGAYCLALAAFCFVRFRTA